MNYQDKKAQRVKGLLAAAERARNEADQAYNRSAEIVGAIPMGQPILVGHHSEKRHRADLARSDAAMRRGVEAQRKAEYYEERAQAAENNRAISSDDPDATNLLKEKLSGLEGEREKIKDYNKTAKREGREIVPAYKLTNLGGRIRDIKKRIERLEQVSNYVTTEEIISGVRLVDNVELNRFQLFFPGKPCDEVRTDLKRSGFRWSPSQGAWQAYRNNRSRFHGRRIVKG